MKRRSFLKGLAAAPAAAVAPASPKGEASFVIFDEVTLVPPLPTLDVDNAEIIRFLEESDERLKDLMFIDAPSGIDRRPLPTPTWKNLVTKKPGSGS